MNEDEEITLESTIDVQDRLIQKYERQIRGLQRKISDLENENTSFKDIKDKLENTVEEQEKEIVESSEKINRMTKNIETINMKIHELETEVKEKSDLHLSKEKELGGLEERNKYLIKDLEEKKQELLNLKEEIRKILDEKVRLSNDLSRVSGIVEERQEKLTMSESHIDNQKARVADLEENLKGKEAKIQELQSLNVTNSSQIAELNNQLGDLKIQVETLTQENEALKNQLAGSADLQKETQELQEKTSELEAQVQQFQGLHSGTIEGRGKIIEFIKAQIGKTISKIFITAPSIMDLKDIVVDLAQITKMIQIRVATHINPEINQHIELLDKFKEVSRIQIRNYPKEDRWCIERDSTAILLAHGGVAPVGLFLEDLEFISLIRNFIAEPWIGSKVM